MSNWSDWLDWGGRPAPVQSLNNLAGPTNPNVPYQWLRPTNPAWYPTPQGLKVPMFGPGNTQIYPMFGEGALPTQPLPAAATPVTQASWAQRAGAVGYPTAPQGASVPMFGPDGAPRYPMFGNGAPTPNAPAGAGPISQQAWAQRATAAGYPVAPGNYTTPLVPNQPSMMPNAQPMNLANPTRTPMFDAAGNPAPITQPRPTPGPGVPTNPYTQPGATTAMKYPMFDGAGNPAPGPVNAPRPPSLMPNAQPMGTTAPAAAAAPAAPAAGVGFPAAGGPTTVPFPNAGQGAPAAAATGSPTPVRPSAARGGLYARRVAAPGTTGYGAPAAGGPGTGSTYTGTSSGKVVGPNNVPPPSAGAAGGTPPPAGAPTPGDPLGAYRNAGWNVNGAPPAGAPGSPGASYANAWRNVGQPTPNPYSAFWGRNPLNVRGALSATGSVGSKLPGVLTAPRNFGPSPTGAIGSRLPGFLTNEMSAGKSFGAGIGTALALHALPGFTAQIAPGITGRPLTEQGMETARSSAGAAGAGLMFGAPVAAAAGVGTFLGDAVGSSGGLGVANTLRGWMGMDPTDDTIGDILGRTPIGGWFGAGGEQQAQDPVAGLPPTLESIATVGQMAGLDPSSVGFLQQQFDGSMALARATYAADPEGSKKQFEALYGRPMESEDDLAQVLFSKIVQESLPAALENQSAQAAALQNAAMYQDFIGKYMQPIRDQYTDLANRATAAGYGDLALQFQGQGASQESAMRAIPNLEALKAQQAQVNQLAQQQWQASMSGGGAAADPLGDAATIDALMAAAG